MSEINFGVVVDVVVYPNELITVSGHYISELLIIANSVNHIFFLPSIFLLNPHFIH